MKEEVIAAGFSLEKYVEKIFFFNEKSNSGMSEELFFTHIYFWMFFVLVLGICAFVEEADKWIKTAVWGTLTLGFVLLTVTYPQLLPTMIGWCAFVGFLVYYSTKDKRRSVRNVFLFLASLFFYYKTSGFFFFILVFSTLLDYTLGIAIFHSREKWKRLTLATLSIVVNLGLLVYFKYAFFFTDSFNEMFGTQYQVHNYLAQWANEATGSHFRVSQILLPVGISFYTFQTISYSVDIYRGHIKKPVYNILDFGFYVSFFPQLVAGPIVRAADFIPQLYKEHKITAYQFGLSLFLILNGLLKKAFLADFIANGFIDGVFEAPTRFTGFENLMAIIGYSLQVYADFSGYTDIAIGIALLLGFRLNTNFNSPYKAKNVGEFWKRWHISLSTWLRDYLYIPLGGNRKGTAATYISLTVLLGVVVLLAGKNWFDVLFFTVLIVLIFGALFYAYPAFRKWLNTNINLMITMLLGGLWHGSSWQFIIWGGLNGLGLVVYKLWRKVSPWEYRSGWLVHGWKVLVTFIFISFTRIFFRSPNMEVANDMMAQIGTSFHAEVIPQVIEVFWFYYLIMIVGYIIHWLPKSFKLKYKHAFIKSPIWVKVLITFVSVVLAYQSLLYGQPFIYFQF